MQDNQADKQAICQENIRQGVCLTTRPEGAGWLTRGEHPLLGNCETSSSTTLAIEGQTKLGNYPEVVCLCFHPATLSYKKNLRN